VKLYGWDVGAESGTRFGFRGDPGSTARKREEKNLCMLFLGAFNGCSSRWRQLASTGLPVSSGIDVARAFGRGPDYLCAQILAAASSVVSGVDMGYAGSAGLEPQQFVSNNQPCGYICYGFGEFDGQGSGHDFSGNVRAPFCRVQCCIR
jgi:hypothetical protein